MKFFKFFTEKKYFFQRHSLVVGAIIILYSNYYYEGDAFNNWGNILLFPIACLIIGCFFNAITFTLSDVFCKEKTIGDLIKH